MLILAVLKSILHLVWSTIIALAEFILALADIISYFVIILFALALLELVYEPTQKKLNIKWSTF